MKHLITFLAFFLLVPLMGGALYVVGTIIDVQTDRSIEHHRCLKDATNGLEIEKCR